MRAVHRQCVALLLALSGAAASAEDKHADAASLRASEHVQQRFGAQAIEVLSVQSHTWSDSSLGCPQPGRSYLHVLTPGHIVHVRADDREHEVRVAGENTLICTRALAGAPRQPQPRTRVSNLPGIEEQAKADLARRLNIPASAVRVIERIPQQWSDASMGCGGGAPASKQSVSGFRLVLRTSERDYTYHTDMQRVAPCPAIEAE